MIVRHAERLDGCDEKWLQQTSRPFDTPVTIAGKVKVVRPLGKTLKCMSCFELFYFVFVSSRARLPAMARFRYVCEDSRLQ